MKPPDTYINETLLITAAKEKFITAVVKEYPYVFHKTINSDYNVPANTIFLTLNLKNLNKEKLFYQIDYCQEELRILSVKEIMEDTLEILKHPYKYL